ncbi:MAG TPA: putative lipid II flippase FtsW [Elusimicrobia bacterium]|nr:putative lipid II flippase FtsW [Elusimicrobiota bacterium]
MDYASKRQKPAYNVINNRNLRFMDYPLFFVVIILLAMGLVSLFSASAIWAGSKGLDTLFFTKKQALFMLTGFGLMAAAMRLDLERVRPYIKPAFLVTAALLLLTLFMPKVAGARRWIPLGFMKLQTSEFAKIIVILYLADYFDRNMSRLKENWRELLKPLVATLVVLALIAAGPDLGTPALIFGVALFMAGAAGVPLKFVLAPLLAAIPVIIVQFILFPYRIARLKAVLSPWNDTSGKGYQLVQGMLAVGSGGWFGKGLGASKLKLMYIPEPHTDFIFPVVAEELGLVGGLFITGLFTALLLKGARIARNAPSIFTSLTALGLTLLISLQAFYNIGMSIGILPTKGIPLPFFSYGGSSIWSAMIMVGIILNVSAHRSGKQW